MNLDSIILCVDGVFGWVDPDGGRGAPWGWRVTDEALWVGGVGGIKDGGAGVYAHVYKAVMDVAGGQQGKP